MSLNKSISLIFITILYIYSCVQNPVKIKKDLANQLPSDTTIQNAFTTKVYDKNGNVVIEYGNGGKKQSPVYFYSTYKYDTLGKILSEKYYDLGEDNSKCIVLDSLDYMETKYIYEDTIIVKKELYIPKYDESSKIIGHKLSDTFYIQNGHVKIIE